MTYPSLLDLKPDQLWQVWFHYWVHHEHNHVEYRYDGYQAWNPGRKIVRLVRRPGITFKPLSFERFCASEPVPPRFSWMATPAPIYAYWAENHHRITLI